jgi:single-strand DNA-binding protein
MNTVCLMGRLTRDPELRHTQVGTAVASFTLAVDRGKSERTGERITDFIDCVAWKGTAEIISKYFAKGQMAAVTGRLQIRDWTDKDGNKRKSAEVVVSKIFFADSKKSREGASQSTEYTSQEFEEFAADDEYDDDLPF